MAKNTLDLVGKALIVKTIIESLNELNDFIVNFHNFLHVVQHYFIRNLFLRWKCGSINLNLKRIDGFMFQRGRLLS
ncbi:hypothetical protein SS16_14835 [Enterobacter hormaechei subsp. xiangfangensis]|nr:hypothetical protein SS16_14835 [Enterobacter hormaechei subsp. xiangfangensis]KZR26391.1 hypothetical protein A3N67_23780 [Enterobacter hormaechei subsp. steigerwaltii]